MYEIILPNEQHLYALAREEEVVLVDALLSVMKFIPPTELWYAEFMKIFFDEGRAILPRQIVSLNSQLRRRNLSQLEFISSEGDDYTLMRGPEKAICRQKLRESLSTMKADLRGRLVTQSRTKAALLEPRDAHVSYMPSNNFKSTSETIRRFAVLRDPANMPQPEIAASPVSMKTAPIVAEPVAVEAPLPVYRVEVHLADSSEALALLSMILKTRSGKVEMLEEGRLIRVW